MNDVNQLRRPLILDLDFTLLHLEQRPDSIEVPGRTRSAWIAPQTIELLQDLQSEFDIVLATARSWDGTRWVWNGLAERDVFAAAIVIEDGARWGQPDALQTMDATFETKALRAIADTFRSAIWPAFEWQHDFQACLVARCENKEFAAQLLDIFAQQVKWSHANLRFFRDGRKVYILPRGADKWSALQKLLGERASSAVGVGDGENDLCWLANIELPCTLTGAAPSIAALVQKKKGYFSLHRGHDGIGHVLRFLAK